MSNCPRKMLSAPRCSLRLVAVSLLGLASIESVIAQTNLVATKDSDVASLPSSVSAQTGLSGSPDNALTEIVVTATRREENQERVPVAVTAYGAAQLQERSIMTEEDLQSAVPGLLIRQTTTQNTPVYSIRGQSVDSYSGSSPAVLPYINDVPLNSTSAQSFFDLSSIQVLKGPQGTLFGRNTTGGAVLYTTTKPTDELSGYVTVRLGNYDLKEALAALNIPLVPGKALLRLAADVDYRNGYVRNNFDGRDLGADQRQSGRATLLLTPMAGLTNTTVFEYDNSRGTNTPLEVYSAYPCGATNHGIPLDSTPSCLYSPALDSVIGAPGAWAAFLAAHPGVNPLGLISALGQQQLRGPWQVSADDSADHRGHNYYVSNTTEGQVSPNFQVKNIFSYSVADSKDEYDADGTSFPVVVSSSPLNPNPAFNYRNRAWTEELQGLGKADSDRLSYVTGFFYSNERDIYDAEFAVFGIEPIIPPTALSYGSNTRHTSEAVYGQATYDLSSLTGVGGLSATGGVRYTWEKLQFAELPTALFRGALPEHTSFSDPSWQVGLQYQLNSELMLYVEQRGSWRNGGYNFAGPPVAAPASQAGNAFYPETTYDVEVGAKYQGSIFGTPLRINIDGYNQWVHNVQRTVYPTLASGPVILTENIPAAEVTGIELDIDASPMEWLELGGNLAVTDARFTSADTTLFGETFDFGPYGDVAKYSGSVFAMVKMPLPDAVGRVTVRADAYAQSGQYFSNLANTIDPGTRLPGYGLVNLRMDWRSIMRSKLTASAFVRNLADKGYYVGGFPGATSFGINSAVPGVPRMYGVELTYAF